MSVCQPRQTIEMSEGEIYHQNTVNVSFVTYFSSLTTQCVFYTSTHQHLKRVLPWILLKLKDSRSDLLRLVAGKAQILKIYISDLHAMQNF